MNENIQPTEAGRRRRMLTAAGLLAAGTVAGGILAGTMSASAATADTNTNGSIGAAASSTALAPRDRAGGSAPVRTDEKALSGTAADKVRAAALAAVPGGTVYRVETDAGDGTYEAHMTKADGTQVTVKLDASYKVTGVEAGMGKGDPHLAGQPDQPGSSGTA